MSCEGEAARDVPLVVGDDQWRGDAAVALQHQPHDDGAVAFCYVVRREAHAQRRQARARLGAAQHAAGGLKKAKQTS